MIAKTIILSIILLSAYAHEQLNVYGQDLKECSTSPMTGFYRDGYCKTGEDDFGTHVVCAKVTDEFLDYSQSMGNNLKSTITDSEGRVLFKGLKDGDKWCLCALRWKQALKVNKAPPLDLAASNVKALDFINIKVLEKYTSQLQ